jgi:hypothetical protein
VRVVNRASTVAVLVVLVVLLLSRSRGASQGQSASLRKGLRLGIRDGGNWASDNARSGSADNSAGGRDDIGSGIVRGEGASGEGRNGGSSSEEGDESKGNFGRHVDDIN